MQNRNIRNNSDLIDLRYVKLNSDPYIESEVVFNVDMDTFAILDENKNGIAFKLKADVDEELENVVTYEQIETLKNVDFLSTHGVSTCIAIYAESQLQSRKVKALAHVSALWNVNDVMEFIREEIARQIGSSPEDTYVEYFLFGGTESTFEDIQDEEPIQAPKGCYADATSRMMCRDSEIESDSEQPNEIIDDALSVFLCKENMIIQRRNGDNDEVIVYEQAYDKSVALTQRINQHGKRHANDEKAKDDTKKLKGFSHTSTGLFCQNETTKTDQPSTTTSHPSQTMQNSSSSV